jgi:pimeloyl-ACP methyl ester carboxylesterase
MSYRRAKLAGVAHHTAALGEVRLHYVIAGEGDAVVLLHGWPQTWYQWRKVIPRLSERYTVVAPDMRGLGDSSRPLGGYDKRTIARDVHELVIKLGFDRVFLVGHDWGGPVAYAYASAHPESVRRLVLVETSIPGHGLDPARWHILFHGVRDLPELLVAGREREYLSWFYRTAHDPMAVDDDAVDEYVRCYSAPGAMRAAFEYYRAIWTDIADNKEHARSKLPMPVLAIEGDTPVTRPIPSPGQSATLEKRWPHLRNLAEDVRGVDLVDCGHWVAEEQPERFLDELLAFFAADTDA